MPTPTKKKVLYVITKSNWGGAQRYVYDIATGLADTHDVTVAHGGSGALMKKLNDAGIATRPLASLQRDISVRQELRAMAELRQIIKTERPDILHINSSKAGLYGSLLGRWLGVPRIIFTAHGWAFNEPRPWISRLVFRLLHWLTVLAAHKTITVSSTLKQQLLLPFWKHKLVTIPLAITPPDYETKTAARSTVAPQVPPQETWFGTIAELHPVKNHETALRALSTIVPTYPTVQYVIVGDGELRDTLEALAVELAIRDQVHFCGHVADAARLVTAFDYFLLPSHSEAAGYVLHEAAHAQVPIIASRVGGIPELINHPEYGTLLPATDTDAWAETMTDALTNPQSYHTKAFNLYRSVVDTRSLTTMLRSTKAIYESSNKLLVTTARS